MDPLSLALPEYSVMSGPGPDRPGPVIAEGALNPRLLQDDRRAAAATTDATARHSMCEALADGAAGCGVDVDALTLDVTAAAAAEAARSSAREAVVSSLEARVAAVVASVDPAAVVRVFGSSRSGFGGGASDVDMCALRPGGGDAGGFLGDVAAAMSAAGGFTGVEVVARARVPIVRFVDAAGGVAGDLCMNNGLALANTELLRAYARAMRICIFRMSASMRHMRHATECRYADADARVRPVVGAVKRWARARGVNSPSAGTLSSYAYVIMAVAFLQRRGVLPHLQVWGARTADSGVRSRVHV